MAKAPVVWRNKSSMFHIGRPIGLDNVKYPFSMVPPGKRLVLGPGDIFYDDVGLVQMIQNAAMSFMAFAHGKKIDIEADIKLMALPPSIEVKWHTVDGEDVAVFFGAPFLLEDVSREYKKALDSSENRIASAKTIADLEAAVGKAQAEKDKLASEVIELKAKLAAKKG